MDFKKHPKDKGWKVKTEKLPNKNLTWTYPYEEQQNQF
jgi:hypothetical protein